MRKLRALGTAAFMFLGSFGLLGGLGGLLILEEETALGVATTATGLALSGYLSAGVFRGETRREG